MKNIAYIEIDTHAEIAGNFMQLMQDSAEFEIDYYLSEKVFKQIEKPSINSIITIADELLGLLKAKKYDLVIIGTAHRYFNVFKKISQRYNTAIIVHNQNFARLKKLQLFVKIFQEDLAYRLKLLLKEGLLAATHLHHQASHLLLLESSAGKEAFKPLPVLFNEFNNTNNSETLTIVIPGSVSQQRRDYAGVLQKLRHFRTEVEVVFLGKAAGPELKRIIEFVEVKPENVKLYYFTEKVEPKAFELWMQKASVLWCPLQPKSTFFSQKETYGYSKMTGNLGDAVRFGKCAVFPKDYPAHDHRFIFTEKENIEEQLILASEFRFDFQKEFSKQAVADSLHSALRSLI